MLNQSMLTMEQMASRVDFAIGSARVSPSARSLQGRGGTKVLEPRTMQVLIVLADDAGSVVTRDTLFRRCWGGTFAGDDSLNRVIAQLRKISVSVGSPFEIETIPRTGYRLVAAETAIAPREIKGGRTSAISRRLVIGGSLIAAASGAALWLGRSAEADPRVSELVDRSREAIRLDLPNSDQQAINLLQEAVEIEPGNAAAWGLMAFALRNRAENAPPDMTGAAVRDCEAAARRALSIDPDEGYALAALATLQPYFGDWGAAEDRLMGVLSRSPGNPAAISHLVTLLQSVGRVRASWEWLLRVEQIEPLSPVHQFRKALKFWIYGRPQDADLVIDRARQLWPRHPGVWNARLYIFAFTDRATAAIRMLGEQASRPPTVSADTVELWRTALTALATRSSIDVGRARDALMHAAPGSPPVSVSAVMLLSALGEIDAAFAVAEGFLLRRGPLVGTLYTGAGQTRVNDQQWRRTMNLFTPATAPMRLDPRFAGLCGGIGLARYWRERHVQPDAFLEMRA